ncbi:MAG: hypothetical protein K2M19_09565 [Muribaculaceae bacterium]|nr:hypothetical protein [Muribaculaceae bacterium]
MKLSDINKFRNSTARKIRDGHILDAIADLRGFVSPSTPWDLRERLDSLDSSYRAMLDFLTRGIADPDRKRVYDEFVVEALAINDALTRAEFRAENPSQYFSLLRMQAMSPTGDIPAIAERIKAEALRLNSDFESINDPDRTRNIEQLQRDFFERVWTAYPLRPQDVQAIDGLMGAPAVGEHIAGLTVSAVWLGLMEYYDPTRLVWLLGTYLTDSRDRIALRALVGAALALFRFRSRPLTRKVSEALAAAKESPTWASDLAAVTIELVRAADTVRITEKLQNEVFPQLMKIDPELQQKLASGEITPEYLAEEGNPEWERMLGDSGAADSLRSLMELQADGGDVFMSTFSQLKGFNLFNHVSGWFMPYHDTYSDVARNDPAGGRLADMVGQLGLLCDSDKFSVMLATGMIPREQVEAMIAAMNMQMEQQHQQLSELEKASPRTARHTIINKYIADVYRFYKLYRRRNEFFDPFTKNPFLLPLASLGADFNDSDAMKAMAEFFFSHKFWPQAATALERLDSLEGPEASRSQKLGYAYELSGELSAAIDAYSTAEMLDGGSVWTIRHLASVLRRTGRMKSAVSYYGRLAEVLPDDPQVAYTYAYTLASAGKYKEAEQHFHKAAYLDPDSLKVMRGLAWTMLLNGKADRASELYATIISRDSTPADILNAGHAARAEGRLADAINLYANYGRLTDPADPVSALIKAMETDRSDLSTAGVDTGDDTLILEAVKLKISR